MSADSELANKNLGWSAVYRRPQVPVCRWTNLAGRRCRAGKVSLGPRQRLLLADDLLISLAPLAPLIPLIPLIPFASLVPLVPTSRLSRGRVQERLPVIVALVSKIEHGIDGAGDAVETSLANPLPVEPVILDEAQHRSLIGYRVINEI